MAYLVSLAVLWLLYRILSVSENSKEKGSRTNSDLPTDDQERKQ